MLLAATDAERIAGALLNDVGPVVEPRGIDHIRSYVGRARDWPTWLHAARFIAEAQRDRYPDWEIDQWLVYAKRLCKLTPGGRIVYDYDMRIAEPFKPPAAKPASICGRSSARWRRLRRCSSRGEHSRHAERRDGGADAGRGAGDGASSPCPASATRRPSTSRRRSPASIGC